VRRKWAVSQVTTFAPLTPQRADIFSNTVSPSQGAQHEEAVPNPDLTRLLAPIATSLIFARCCSISWPLVLLIAQCTNSSLFQNPVLTNLIITMSQKSGRRVKGFEGNELAGAAD
jgi:hypothetical protein